jgi:hypothetical protein
MFSLFLGPSKYVVWNVMSQLLECSSRHDGFKEGGGIMGLRFFSRHSLL